MSFDITESSISDDEIFFGKLTLKEVKKRIFWDNQQKPYAVSAVNSPRQYGDRNESLRILQTHSEPNLLPGKGNEDSPDTIISGWDMREDDSFIKLESMVEKLCVSPTPTNNKKTEELNNTLEVIEYILNNPPNNENKPETPKNIQDDVKPVLKTENEVLSEICLKKLQKISPQKCSKLGKVDAMDSPEPPQNTPVKSAKKFVKDAEFKTPVDSKKYIRDAEFKTPVDSKPKPIFKTPAQPLSLKKPSATSLKKTPSKSNAYQHISSPVASYIKNCPIVPLVKDVHPKKPLPGPSSIPKLKSSVPIKSSNKENVNLPSVAYKSAKKTKLIDLPDEQKLPQSQWAKKIMTSLPKPMVIKHNHRELNFAKRKLLPQCEDSFANLSYHQAEVSVCTQKSAFKTPTN
ncbi:uncharacterized protein LOC142973696 [Anticarsia gemmatalis]|uniref:uncharacterized protein LOC142973696 n=1 Tax=Anticarsia gemmatalis TaxID=129554 RepID=UPI003F758E62